ncbi:MAG: hypothetical protein JKY84_03745 [Emcibacteraceae bacterium]|nr:hypothetical protein [Emcibacteraceae bacterium]
MIILVTVFALIIWFLAGIAISFLLVGVAKKRGWLNTGKKHLVLKIVLSLIIFMLPAVPNFISYYYVKFTFPMVCQQMDRDKQDAPVEITLFRSTCPMTTINISGLDYVSWAMNEETEQKWGSAHWTDGFEYGEYYFKYYPKGSQECRDLLTFYPDAKNDINRGRQSLADIGYSLKDISNQCVGIEKTQSSQFQYKQKFRFWPYSEINIPTKFGYRVNKKGIWLIDNQTDKTVSERYSYSAIIPKFILTSWFYPVEMLSMSCDIPYKDKNKYGYDPDLSPQDREY